MGTMDFPTILLTEKQAACFLSVSVKTLQAWRVSGRGPVFTKVGRLVRYTQDDMMKFVQEHRHRSTCDTSATRTNKKAIMGEVLLMFF